MSANMYIALFAGILSGMYEDDFENSLTHDEKTSSVDSEDKLGVSVLECLERSAGSESSGEGGDGGGGDSGDGDGDGDGGGGEGDGGGDGSGGGGGIAVGFGDISVLRQSLESDSVIRKSIVSQYTHPLP